MAVCLRKASICSALSLKVCTNIVRHGHHLRGKAPGAALTLEQRLNQLNSEDPSVHYRVDIGFPAESVSRSEVFSKRLQHIKVNRKNTELEKLSRSKQLFVDLEDVGNEWSQTAGPYHIKKIADHYGVYNHLFGDAYFIPRTPLRIFFGNGDKLSPVYYGNLVKPTEATKAPKVSFSSENDCYWTLILTNPDGHFTERNSEYVHWFVGNIPGNKMEKGEIIMEYMQPFPPKGTGYHRHIFILYKQNKKLDFSHLKKTTEGIKLSDRTFSTLNFYKERQDDLTPSGLAFFQSDWDSSLTDYYHNILNMKEPFFEYDFPEPYIRPQKWFPLRQPFNIYMDKYKDEKEVKERFFKEKLKNVHPFQTPKPPLQFPNAESIPRSVPSWLKNEIRKKRLGWGRINDV